MTYTNRELSWLEFNQRVLDEGSRKSLPLLERLKFIAITASNLDEFFQVRVGGLHLMRASGSRKRGISGLTPSQQLSAIRTRAKQCRQWNVQTCEGVRDLWSLTGLCIGVVDISSPCVEQKLRPFAHRSAWDGWMGEASSTRLPKQGLL